MFPLKSHKKGKEKGKRVKSKIEKNFSYSLFKIFIKSNIFLFRAENLIVFFFLFSCRHSVRQHFSYPFILTIYKITKTKQKKGMCDSIFLYIYPSILGLTQSLRDWTTSSWYSVRQMISKFGTLKMFAASVHWHRFFFYISGNEEHHQKPPGPWKACCGPIRTTIVLRLCSSIFVLAIDIRAADISNWLPLISKWFGYRRTRNFYHQRKDCTMKLYQPYFFHPKPFFQGIRCYSAMFL